MGNAAPRRPRDPNQLAKLIVDIAAGDAPDERSPKDEKAVTRGRKGGDARAAATTPQRRTEIAQKAARARWKDKS